MISTRLGNFNQFIQALQIQHFHIFAQSSELRISTHHGLLVLFLVVSIACVSIIFCTLLPAITTRYRLLLPLKVVFVVVVGLWLGNLHHNLESNI